MKPFFILLSFFVFLFPENSSAQKLHPAKDNIACVWGLKNDSGIWVVKPQFEDLRDFIWHRALFRLGEKWGVIRDDGKILVPAGYDNIDINYSYANEGNSLYYYEGYIPEVTGCRYMIARNHPDYFLLDSNGQKLHTASYQEIVPAENGFRIRRNDLVGWRTTEKEIIPPKYTYLEPVMGKMFIVSTTKQDESAHSFFYWKKNIGLINADDKVLIPFEYNEITFPVEYSFPYSVTYEYPEMGNVITVIRDSLHGFYDLEGKQLHPCRYVFRAYAANQNIGRLRTNQKIIVWENGKSGVLQLGKGMMIPAKYDAIQTVYQNSSRHEAGWIVQQGNHKQFIFENGKLLPAPDFTYLERESTNRFYIRNADKHWFCDTAGKMLCPEKFDSVYHYTYPRIAFSGSTFFYQIDNDFVRVTDAEKFRDSIIRFTVRFPNKTKSMVYFRQTRKGWKHLSAVQVTTGVKNPLIIIWDEGRNYYTDSAGKNVLWPEAYQNIRSGYGYSASQLIVETVSGKIGIVDGDGRLVLDTAFELIGEYKTGDYYWVKPWQPYDTSIFRKCSGGWALADSNGHLVTAPQFIAPDYAEEHWKILRTKRGLGVFDMQKMRFTTAPGFLSAGMRYPDFFPKYFILRTATGKFAATDTSGTLISDSSWTKAYYLNAKNALIIPYISYADSTILIAPTEGWFLQKKDSLVFVNEYGMERDQKTVRKYFLQLCAGRTFSFADKYYYPQKGVDYGGPRLQYSDSIPEHHEKFLLKKILSNCDTTLFHEANFYFGITYCDYSGSPASEDISVRPDDYPVDNYNYFEPNYRVSYFDDQLISIQTFITSRSGYFNNKYETPSFSEFGNYSFDGKNWNVLRPENIFKTGWQKVLTDALRETISKSDAMELDCTDPGMYMSLPEVPFSISKDGIYFYLHDSNSAEYYSPLLVNWQSISSVIPKKSPLRKFVK